MSDTDEDYDNTDSGEDDPDGYQSEDDDEQKNQQQLFEELKQLLF